MHCVHLTCHKAQCRIKPVCSHKMVYLLLVCVFQGALPFPISCTSGTMVQATFDQLDTIADMCEKHKLWMHVDVSHPMCKTKPICWPALVLWSPGFVNKNIAKMCIQAAWGGSVFFSKQTFVERDWQVSNMYARNLYFSIRRRQHFACTGPDVKLRVCVCD